MAKVTLSLQPLRVVAALCALAACAGDPSAGPESKPSFAAYGDACESTRDCAGVGTSPLPGLGIACRLDETGVGPKRCLIESTAEPAPPGMAGPCRTDADCAGLSLHPSVAARGYTRHICRESGIETAGKQCYPSRE